MEDEISEVVGSLPPGFRFDPTDEELLNRYLKPKILGQPGKHTIIPEIDACRLEPEKWPTMFRHKFKSKELFFFCHLKHKYSNSERYYDRTTSGGYWKVTSTDRLIMSEDTNAKIGIMKTLVFHRGSLAKNESSNWVCHEYHLNHNEDEMPPPYVVCRIKNKKEKKLITALAPTISPEGSSSRPHAYTRNVSGTLVNQEGDHSTFCNTLNNEVAGNQEAVNAQPETSAEELTESRPPILGPDEILPDNNNILPYQPHAEAGDGSSYIHDFSNDNWWMRYPYSDPANYSSFGTLPDYNIPENYSSSGWESGTMPQHFSTPYSDPPNYSSFGTLPDYNILENYSSSGWESGTMPEHFSTPTRDNG